MLDFVCGFQMFLEGGVDVPCAVCTRSLTHCVVWCWFPLVVVVMVCSFDRLNTVETSKMLTAMKAINSLNMALVISLAVISFARLFAHVNTSGTVDDAVQRFFVAGYTL